MHSCAICNAVFICLDIYQQHRKDHAKKEGVELHACNHCSYATDNAFHFNWHAMSHASEDRHQCDYCRHQRRNEEDKSWSSASKESDFDESMLPGRISESSVSFGKRYVLLIAYLKQLTYLTFYLLDPSLRNLLQMISTLHHHLYLTNSTFRQRQYTILVIFIRTLNILRIIN